MNISTNESINTDATLSDNLWDEITKSIVNHMPEQLFPLFKEAFGKEYPKGTSIQLLQTEYPVPDKKATHKLTSIFSDITLLVNGCDLYHLECQMTNDEAMVVRMIEYDFHIALSHGIQMESPNVFTLYFPNSTILYPASNNAIPSHLVCHVIFPDGSAHTYQVPTMKIQSYSLSDIRQKHLTMFLPFKLLSFRPRLKSVANPITVSELTEYMRDIIVILEEEKKAGNITELEFKNYLTFIKLAAERVFHQQEHLKQEVLNVTKSVLIIPSDYEDIIKEKESTIREQDSTIKKQDSTIKEQDSTIKEQDSTIKKQDFTIKEQQNENNRLRQKLIAAGINPDE